MLPTKIGGLLRKDYDWSKEVAAIKAPTMLVFAEKDAGWDGSGLSNARRAILPGLTHYNIFSSPALAPAVTPFLDAPVPETK